MTYEDKALTPRHLVVLSPYKRAESCISKEPRRSMWKSPVLFVERALFFLSKEHYFVCQKSSIVSVKLALFLMSKEPCLVCQRSPDFYGKRALFCLSENFYFVWQSALLFVKRALFCLSKEPFVVHKSACEEVCKSLTNWGSMYRSRVFLPKNCSFCTNFVPFSKSLFLLQKG